MLKSVFRNGILATTGAVLALSIGAAGAYYTTQVKVADSIIEAGTLAVSVTPTSAPLSITGIAPGATAVRPLSIKNTGDLPADIVITAKKEAGITDFFNILTCRVTAAGTEVYNGNLSALQTTAVRVPSGTTADYRFEVGMPSSVGNTMSGDYAKVSLYVDGEQVP